MSCLGKPSISFAFKISTSHCLGFLGGFSRAGFPALCHFSPCDKNATVVLAHLVLLTKKVKISQSECHCLLYCDLSPASKYFILTYSLFLRGTKFTFLSFLIFLYEPSLKPLLNLLQHCFCFYLFIGNEACGILALQPLHWKAIS